MAHPMEGNWRSSVLVGGVPVDDGVIHLDSIDPTTGRIVRGNHEIPGTTPVPITGSVSQVGRVFRLTMERPEIGSTRTFKVYDSTVILDLGLFTVMVGNKSTRITQPLKPEDRIDAAALVQDDGTVIITRP